MGKKKSLVNTKNFDKIISKRKINDKIEYFIKLKEGKTVWESKENLTKLEKYLDDFDRKEEEDEIEFKNQKLDFDCKDFQQKTISSGRNNNNNEIINSENEKDFNINFSSFNEIDDLNEKDSTKESEKTFINKKRKNSNNQNPNESSSSITNNNEENNNNNNEKTENSSSSSSLNNNKNISSSSILISKECEFITSLKSNLSLFKEYQINFSNDLIESVLVSITKILINQKILLLNKKKIYSKYETKTELKQKIKTLEQSNKVLRLKIKEFNKENKLLSKKEFSLFDLNVFIYNKINLFFF